nr:hypothetical protein Itr_chr08CG15870 [Ipomoea trifida]
MTSHMKESLLCHLNTVNCLNYSCLIVLILITINYTITIVKYVSFSRSLIVNYYFFLETVINNNE